MKNVFGRGEKEWNSERTKVKDLMVRSFHSQRKSINEGKDMSDIKEAWPFLFEFLFVHFEELMGFPLLSTLMAAIRAKGVVMRQYLAAQHEDKRLKKVKAVLEDAGPWLTDGAHINIECAVAVLLLQAYFGEKNESLFYFTEEVQLWYNLTCEI